MHSIYFYRDQDGDTYGNVADFVTNYTGIAPTGYVSNSTDCNDNNSNVNPGAVEICGNGIDDNCNGQIDETTLQTSSLAGVITCVGGTTTVECRQQVVPDHIQVQVCSPLGQVATISR